MNEQERQEKRLYAGDKQPSMKRRSDENDYHGRHIYMLTLVVEGRLLMLAPWEHHNDKQSLTAAKCSAMNVMALDIANPTNHELQNYH